MLAFVPPKACVAVLVNPLAGADKEIAFWFHAHLTRTFVFVLQAFSHIGAAELIGVVLFCLTLFFLWKRRWPSLVTLVLAVPGGMLLNEWVKLLVHRHRPFVEGPFVDWSGYSFASGHTIGATLLYGQLAMFIVPAIRSRRWRIFTIIAATVSVVLVGFSRIALGAHYLTDVLGAIIFGLIWLALCLVVGKPLRKASLPVPIIPALELPAELVPNSIESAAPAVVQPSRDLSFCGFGILPRVSVGGDFIDWKPMPLAHPCSTASAKATSPDLRSSSASAGVPNTRAR